MAYMVTILTGANHIPYIWPYLEGRGNEVREAISKTRISACSVLGIIVLIPDCNTSVFLKPIILDELRRRGGS